MSRFVIPITEPLGLFWLLLLLLIAWRAYRREWNRLVLPALLAAVTFVFCSTSLSNHLLASLERPYAGVDISKLPQADAVVMLGGQIAASANDIFRFHVTDAADRVITAIELVRQGKARALVFGGGDHGAGPGGLTEGEALEHWIRAWQVSNANVPIYILGSSTSTREEAERAKTLIQREGWHRIILVTSAFHMKRSEAVFRNLNIPVTCVACDFRALSSFEEMGSFGLFPRLGGLEMLGIYLHEEVAWWMYRLRGWVAVDPERRLSQLLTLQGERSQVAQRSGSARL